MSTDPDVAARFAWWARESASTLIALHAHVGEWPHVHTALRPSFDRTHPEAPLFEQHAAVIGPGLVDLARLVAAGEDGREVYLVLGFVALLLVTVPAFEIELAREKGAAPDEGASRAATRLLVTLRALTRLLVLEPPIRGIEVGEA